MMIGKLALSLFVAAGSGAYVWSQAGAGSTDPLSALPADDIETGSIAAKAPALPPPPVQAASGLLPSPAAAMSNATLPAFRPERDEDDGEEAHQDGEEDEDWHRAQLPPPLPLAPQPMAQQQGAVVPQPSAAPQPAVARLPHPRPTTGAPEIMLAAMKTAAGRRYGDGVYTGPVTDAYYGPMQIQAVVQNGRLSGIRVLRYPSDRRTSVRINHYALPMLRDEAVAVQSANVDIVSGATLSSEAFIRSLGGAMRQASSSN